MLAPSQGEGGAKLAVRRLAVIPKSDLHATDCATNHLSPWQLNCVGGFGISVWYLIFEDWLLLLNGGRRLRLRTYSGTALSLSEERTHMSTRVWPS